MNHKVTRKLVTRALQLAEQAQVSLDSPGLCLACGAQASGIEPDARECDCERCGEPAVFGAEQIVLEFA
jgi:hypothetical protein